MIVNLFMNLPCSDGLNFNIDPSNQTGVPDCPNFFQGHMEPLQPRATISMPYYNNYFCTYHLCILYYQYRPLESIWHCRLQFTFGMLKKNWYRNTIFKLNIIIYFLKSYNHCKPKIFALFPHSLVSF